MIRRRFERALEPIWRFHRWFDDLSTRKMDEDRFIIFMTLIVIAFLLPAPAMFVFGLPYITGQFLTVVFMMVLGLTRIYYLNYLPKK